MAGERILIVEDERAVARGLTYALQAEGFQISWADSGQRGLDLAAQTDPHLIVLDIRLPDLNGFDVCRRLRSQGRRQPILMLTARDEEYDRLLGFELGVDDYVAKPFSPRELIARMKALLKRSGTLETARQILNFGSIRLCLLYTSDAADERSSVDIGGRRIIKKKKKRREKVDI